MILRIEHHYYPDHARYIDTPGWYTVIYSNGRYCFFYAGEKAELSGTCFLYMDWLSFIEEQR